ncbi:MAG: hypothetical protein DRG78_06255 [Epsilonproteobacteria bacterium]|nr:MAG: hypothetical protein DRG78_06255 [Campylobacterota bacterium]
MELDLDYKMIERLSQIFQEALLLINNAVYKVFLDTLTPFLLPVIHLYILILGYKIMLGEVETSQKNLVRFMIIFPFIILIVLDYGSYTYYIINPLLSIKSYLMSGISMISNESDANAFKALDDMFITMFKFAASRVVNKSWWDINLIDMALSLLLYFMYGLLYIAIGSFYIISLVIPNLFFMAGAIPLAMYAFEGTKGITSSWFKITITYLLYGPIASIMMIFIFYSTKIVVATINENPLSIFFSIFVAGALLVMVKMIPELANGVMSSMSSGGGDMPTGVGYGKTGVQNTVAAGKAAGNLISKFRK